MRYRARSAGSKMRACPPIAANGYPIFDREGNYLESRYMFGRISGRRPVALPVSWFGSAGHHGTGVWQNQSMAQALSDLLTPERLAALHTLADKYGVKDVRVFGSYARGDAKPDSDLDLLVNIEYGRGVAMRLVRFYQEARTLFGVNVDVVTADGLDPRLHARVFREARPIG